MEIKGKEFKIILRGKISLTGMRRGDQEGMVDRVQMWDMEVKVDIQMEDILIVDIPMVDIPMEDMALVDHLITNSQEEDINHNST